MSSRTDEPLWNIFVDGQVKASRQTRAQTAAYQWPPEAYVWDDLRGRLIIPDHSPAVIEWRRLDLGPLPLAVLGAFWSRPEQAMGPRDLEAALRREIKNVKALKCKINKVQKYLAVDISLENIPGFDPFNYPVYSLRTNEKTLVAILATTSEHPNP